MGLESPLALAALAGIALPIIAHLVRRRDLPRVPLPTLALLERARVQSRRRARLVDLLLLAVRIAIIALAATALAGPYATVSLAFGDGRVVSVAIVVDDSMSMGRSEHGGSGPTLLERATGRARSVISSLPRGSEVAIVLAGRPARVLLPRTTDLDLAASALDRLPASTARGTDLAGGVDRALRALGGARNDARRMLVLSDFASHTHASEIAWPTSEVDVKLEPIGRQARADDWSVVAADARPDPSRPGRASIAVEVRGSGVHVHDATIVVRARGNVIGRAPIALGAHGGRVTVDVPMPASGDPTATVEVTTADALAMDDRRGVLLRRSEAARLLVVDGDPHVSRADDELRFLGRALEAGGADRGRLDVRVVDADSFASVAVADIEVIWLANVPAPSAELARRLTDAVHRGCGLVVSVGDRVDPRAWGAILGALLPARPIAIETTGDALGLDLASARAPVPVPSSGLARVTTHRRMQVEAPRDGGRIVLRYTDGTAAVLVAPSGDGSVALLTTSVDDDWTDLPYHPGFVPLVLSLVAHVSPSASLDAGPYPPGEPITIPALPGATSLSITGPDGREHELPVTGAARRVTFRATDRPGAYRVRVSARGGSLAETERLAFVVAPPADESDFGAGRTPDLVQAHGSSSATAPATVRKPFAHWLFFLCGLCACLEGALRLTRPRK